MQVWLACKGHLGAGSGAAGLGREAQRQRILQQALREGGRGGGHVPGSSISLCIACRRAAAQAAPSSPPALQPITHFQCHKTSNGWLVFQNEAFEDGDVQCGHVNAVQGCQILGACIPLDSGLPHYCAFCGVQLDAMSRVGGRMPGRAPCQRC